MSQNQQAKPSIGAEIPYRRDQIEKKTGSLVFDRHLDEATSAAPQQQSSAGAARQDDIPPPGQLN